MQCDWPANLQVFMINMFYKTTKICNFLCKRFPFDLEMENLKILGRLSHAFWRGQVGAEMKWPAGICLIFFII